MSKLCGPERHGPLLGEVLKFERVGFPAVRREAWRALFVDQELHPKERPVRKKVRIRRSILERRVVMVETCYNCRHEKQVVRRQINRGLSVFLSNTSK